jgi:hypothetical protein
MEARPKEPYSLLNTDAGADAAFQFNNAASVNVQRIFELSSIDGDIILNASNGSPEGVYEGNAGDVYFDMTGTTSGGQMYVKTNFGGNTGWVGVATVDMLGNIATSTNEVDTLQTVTNRGNVTTNTIQIAGGTSTGAFKIIAGADTSTFQYVSVIGDNLTPGGQGIRRRSRCC